MIRPRSLRRQDRAGQRGQGLVELALVLPIFAVLVVSIVEVGLIYGAMQTIGYASRDGARVGAALAQGSNCGSPPNPGIPDVDAVVLGAVQRILKSPDSGVKMPLVNVRIFKTDATGREISDKINTWGYLGPGLGPDVDPAAGTEKIDFQQLTQQWPACTRINGGVSGPDFIGVNVRYRYDFVTPMGAVINALAGGNLNVTLSETTVMALNPTV
ncbi:MAG TPA: TadE family protein [Vicinamibacterales bacterium]